ncbi:MAG: ribosome biogenesis GTPase Der, partial [Pyrinomonadaceae bacterium]
MTEGSSDSKTKIPLVAIIGRPNVGKSTLFNRLVGERRSIVGDEPGITRDRIYGYVEWNDSKCSVVDTGGIVPDEDALIPANIFKQATQAIAEAEALIWVVDVRAGITPLDEDLARLIRQTGKRVIIACNKADTTRVELEAGSFYRFGFPSIHAISAEHGNGVAEMLNELFSGFDSDSKSELDEDDLEHLREIKLAIVGRPNVGKSSLLNKLANEDRVIVAPQAGTTRDAVDTTITRDGQIFRLIDTAGIRRKGKTFAMTEKLSVMMARRSLERADVAIVMVDATEGVVALDANIAGYAHEAGCSIILAVNKWDAVPEKKTGSVSEFTREVHDKMKFLEWAPVITLSALNGQRVDNLLVTARRAAEARKFRIPTSELNDFFERAIAPPRGGKVVAAVKSGKARVRVQYVTQVGVRPPTFVLFTRGGKGELHFSYLRYLQNR